MKIIHRGMKLSRPRRYRYGRRKWTSAYNGMYFFGPTYPHRAYGFSYPSRRISFNQMYCGKKKAGHGYYRYNDSYWVDNVPLSKSST